MEGKSTNCRVKATGSAGRSTACRGPSRQFLCAAIIASALFLVSCGSAKTAARAEVKRQTASDIRTGVSLEVTSQESAPVVESPELSLPMSAVRDLPEKAEFSRQEGNTRVFVRKGKGDSLMIGATGIRQNTSEVKVKAGAAAQAATDDSTNVTAGNTQRRPRDSLSNPDGKWQLLAGIIVFSVAGIIIYRVSNHKTTKS